MGRVSRRAASTVAWLMPPAKASARTPSSHVSKSTARAGGAMTTLHRIRIAAPKTNRMDFKMAPPVVEAPQESGR